MGYFDDYTQRAAYYGGAGIEGGAAGADPEEEDPEMSKRERRRRRAERRERVADVWDELGFEVEAGPVKVAKEARPRGRGRGRGRAPSGVTVTPQIPRAVYIGGAALLIGAIALRGR